MKEKGDGNNVYDIAFSQKEGQNHFASCGAKHIKFWAVDRSIMAKKGIHGSCPMTSHACVCWDDTGRAFSGGSNSLIYVWNGA